MSNIACLPRAGDPQGNSTQTRHIMKSWLIALQLFLMILLGALGCGRPLKGSQAWVPPCEQNQIGTLCFYNETSREVEVAIGQTEARVRSETTLCMDIYAGNYEYKARQGWRKWKDEVEVVSCSSSYINIFR